MTSSDFFSPGFKRSLEDKFFRVQQKNHQMPKVLNVVKSRLGSSQYLKEKS